MLNAAQLHLLVNHMPLAALGFSFLILIWGKTKNNMAIIKVAFALLILGGFFAAASFLSGDEAKELVENLPNFSKDHANEHELAAKFGLWWTIFTAVIAAFGFFQLIKKGSLARWLFYSILFFNLFTLTVLARTNHLGGQISHPELRPK